MGSKNHKLLDIDFVPVQELMFPFALIAKNFEKLRHWEEPHLTIAFLGLTYTILYR